MIELLPKWHLHGNRPSFYDMDSVTLLELASKLHGAMNELIADYNRFVDEVNQRITDFTTSTNQDIETFEIAMRQEFQDFIDVVNLKYAGQIPLIEQTIANGIKAIQNEANKVVGDINSIVESEY